ncbi:lipid-A-disaccharide synthase [Rhizobium sp. PAMB 3182]
MAAEPLKIAVIAGEVSGDLLGADVLSALRRRLDGPIEIIGVGGEAMEAEGLKSLFDFSELSIMGISAVVAKLPQLVRRIRQTADAIVAARPDILLIIDSPDFTHRVARRVKKALPDLPVVNYVCPSVWAWKEYRATKMLAYVDRVLALLPFEPAVMERLGGPKTDFVGHRLTNDGDLLAVRRARLDRPDPQAAEPKTVLLMPGSRGVEIKFLLPVLGEAMRALRERHPDMRFVLPAVPRQEARIREVIADWPEQPEIVVGPEQKWKALAVADAAIAASGTVILELALARVPVVSIYRGDWIINLVANRIKVWSAALPNLIADYTVVPEYFNDMLRPGRLVRWVERLIVPSLERQAMLQGYDTVWERLSTERPPGELAAEIILDVLKTKKPGHF